jgi:hypothetical protein
LIQVSITRRVTPLTKRNESTVFGIQYRFTITTGLLITFREWPLEVAGLKAGNA